MVNTEVVADPLMTMVRQGVLTITRTKFQRTAMLNMVKMELLEEMKAMMPRNVYFALAVHNFSSGM